MGQYSSTIQENDISVERNSLKRKMSDINEPSTKRAALNNSDGTGPVARKSIDSIRSEDDSFVDEESDDDSFIEHDESFVEDDPSSAEESEGDDLEEALEVNEPLSKEEEEREALDVLRSKGFSTADDVLKSVGVNSTRYHQETVDRYLRIIENDDEAKKIYAELEVKIKQFEAEVKKGVESIIAAALPEKFSSISNATKDAIANVLKEIIRVAGQNCVTIADYRKNEEVSAADAIQALKTLGVGYYGGEVLEQEAPVYFSESDEEPEYSGDEEEDEKGHFEVDTFKKMVEVHTGRKAGKFSSEASEVLRTAAEHYMLNLLSTANEMAANYGKDCIDAADVNLVVKIWSTAPTANHLVHRIKI